MERKRVIRVTCIFIFLFLLGSIILNYPANTSIISGKAVTATVSFTILGDVRVNVTAPQNITYNFTKTDRVNNNYTLDLNVTSNTDSLSWTYDLYDLKHDENVNLSVLFEPNTTFNAVRWSNELTVHGEDDSGDEDSDSVVFFVFVPNSAPEILNLTEENYFCEGDSVSEFFNTSDVDEDRLQVDINPVGPFYVNPHYTNEGDIISRIELYSGLLEKEDVGYYERVISANDMYNDTCCVDTKDVNMTIIGINNAPETPEIGVQTVNTKGENSTFYYEVNVSDVEDGDNRSSGNFNFSLNISGDEDLFNISDTGVINFTPNDSHIGVYNVSIYITDQGINDPHEKIMEECGQTGDPITTEENFSLTVTDENRAPIITDYYPENLTLNVKGAEGLYFNITKYDPDETIPDTYWYVGGSLKEYDTGNSTDEFRYSFGCGVEGNYDIIVNVTDGLLGDSVTWNVEVEKVACSTPPPKGGGGGGGGISCIEDWVCGNWHVCQSLDYSLEQGLFSGEDYREVKSQCENLSLDMNKCGVQIRDCTDLNFCNTTYKKPEQFQACYYVKEPSCYDGVQNCHHGSCELLVDCGGPCDPCPTCSDGIQNQGEDGVDCGGPCPYPCPPKKPLFKYIMIILILLILIVLILIKIVKILRVRQRLNKYE